MQITKTSWYGPDRAATIYEQRERLGSVGFFPEALEANDQQLERALSHLAEKMSELERYVYLIRLCDRNERLFQKLLMSKQIRFLLPSDCRRRLHEIWLDSRSFEWGAHSIHHKSRAAQLPPNS
jgi:hypothetical protein